MQAVQTGSTCSSRVTSQRAGRLVTKGSNLVCSRSPFSSGSRSCTSNKRSQQCRAIHPSRIVCITGVSEDDFKAQVLESDTPVLVDFWATWCGPCKLIEKPLANMEKELDGKLKIVKVEADPNPGLVEKYKVYGLPTLVVFKDGKVLDGSQREGAISEPELRKYLDKWEVSKQ